MEKGFLSPITYYTFSECTYFSSGIPREKRYRRDPTGELIANASLKTILKLEAKECKIQKIKSDEHRLTLEILDKDLPKLLQKIELDMLPPQSKTAVFLFDKFIGSWDRVQQKLGIEIPLQDSTFFESCLLKLALCLPKYGDHIYKMEFYDRSTLVYCGLCDDTTSAKNPMTLKQASDHFGSSHKNDNWKKGMLRLSPAGQPVCDGQCFNCRVPLLAQARRNEVKSGVECKRCRQKACFNCMDKRIWLEANSNHGSMNPLGKVRKLTNPCLLYSRWGDLFVWTMS